MLPTENLFLEAIKLCYGLVGKDDKPIEQDYTDCERNRNKGDTSLITLALASGLPQYFAMLYSQLKEDDVVSNGYGRGRRIGVAEGAVSPITMSALMDVLSLDESKRLDQSYYTYPQFCSALLEQFHGKFLPSPVVTDGAMVAPQLKLPTMQSHLDDLLKSSDWQWQSMECLNERFLLNKLLTSAAEQDQQQQQQEASPNLHTLRLYDLEIENLTRQVVHKNVENDVLKTVCHDLCSHIRRVDSTCLALRVKLARNSMLMLKNSDEFASDELDDEQRECGGWKNSISTNSAEIPQKRNSMASNFAAAVKRNGSVRKLKKMNSRLVKQMHSISNKMSTLRRTLSDAAPFVRRLEDIFVNASSKRSNSPSKCEEKHQNSCATANNVSVADSGWMSDDDMQFSEAMTTSGASDLFVQSAPIENGSAGRPALPMVRTASLEAAVIGVGAVGIPKKKSSVPVASGVDDLSEASSRRSEEERMLQYSFAESKISPNNNNPSLQETDDDEDALFYCEKDDYYQQRREPGRLFEDDQEEEEEEEDTTTRELKTKLFVISQRLNEAEAKLHRVLRNTN